MVKLLITGGSGFIGTNFIDYIYQDDYEIINLDILPPRNVKHKKFWIHCDICDKDSLIEAVLNFMPNYIVHLAARTDLDEKLNIEGYNANIIGVENIMEVANSLKSLNRIVIASSMLVNKVGDIPNDFNDYTPNSLYGESKVLTEKIVKKYNMDWVIVRPTSIWGPWFAQPYLNFFSLVMKGYYVNLPAKKASTKTYGYVLNTCYQIKSILLSNLPEVKNNYYYLGDKTPINITEWAILIRKVIKKNKLITVPIFSIKLASLFGDTLYCLFGFRRFPLNSFRYKNMTTDNVILDLVRTESIAPNSPYDRLEDCVSDTIRWIENKDRVTNKNH
jgi:nucleoside-diphosphate-sugar epimerase